MPIRFEQPDPVGQFPEAAASAGIVHQYNQDRQAYMQQLQMQQRAQMQTQALAAQGGQANAARAGQAEQAQASRSASDRDLFQASTQSNLLAQQGAQQAALQQQHAQAQAWLNQQDLSQQESLQLQRLTQSVGAVAADDSLEPEDKAQLVTMLRQRIDPLKARQQLTEQRAMDLAEKKQAEAEKARAINSKVYTDLSASGGDPIRELDDGTRVLYHPDGKTTIIPPEDGGGKSRGTKGAGVGAAHGDALQKLHIEAASMFRNKETGAFDAAGAKEWVESAWSQSRELQAQAAQEDRVRDARQLLEEHGWSGMDADKLPPRQQAKLRIAAEIVRRGARTTETPTPGAKVAKDVQGNAADDAPWVRPEGVMPGHYVGTDGRRYYMDLGGKVFLDTNTGEKQEVGRQQAAPQSQFEKGVMGYGSGAVKRQVDRVGGAVNDVYQRLPSVSQVGNFLGG